MNTWEDMPSCKRCGCSAARHASKTGEKLDLDGGSFTETFELGPCRESATARDTLSSFPTRDYASKWRTPYEQRG